MSTTFYGILILILSSFMISEGKQKHIIYTPTLEPSKPHATTIPPATGTPEPCPPNTTRGPTTKGPTTSPPTTGTPEPCPTYPTPVPTTKAPTTSPPATGTLELCPPYPTPGPSRASKKYHIASLTTIPPSKETRSTQTVNNSSGAESILNGNGVTVVVYTLISGFLLL